MDAPTFWSKVAKRDNGCWEWTGAVHPATGYGAVRWDSRTVGAHRLAWRLTHGYWAPDCVCHRCDNRVCINPEHLFRGTKADNTADMVRKGRSTPPRDICPRGHSMANAYQKPNNGGRECRECRRASKRRYVARQGVMA